MQSINGDWGTQYGNRIMAGVEWESHAVDTEVGGEKWKIFFGEFLGSLHEMRIGFLFRKESHCHYELWGRGDSHTTGIIAFKLSMGSR